MEGKTLEQELLEKSENERKAREKAEAELAEFKKKEVEQKLQYDLEMKKIKEERSLYENQAKALSDEKFISDLKSKFPDVDVTLLAGTNEEKQKQAEAFQKKIGEYREKHRSDLALKMGNIPIDTPLLANGLPANPEEAKQLRIKERERLSTSGPRNEEQLSVAMLNNKILFGSKVPTH